MLRPRLIFAVLLLLIAATACTDSGTATPPPEDLLENAVAATLTARIVLESGADGKQVPAETQPEQLPPEETLPAERPSPETAASYPPCIVYTNTGNVWLLEATDPPAQLTSSGDASKVLISTDCEKVAFVRRSGPDQLPEIRSVNTDGSGEMVLLTSAQINALYPLDPNFSHNDIANIEFIPGSHDLMFNTRAVPTGGPGLAKYNDLVRLNSDTGTLTTIFQPGNGGDFVLAPDGVKLVLLLPNTISLVNVDGSNLQANLIAYTPVITYSEFQYYAQPVWTPNSDAFGLAIPSSDPLGSALQGMIWRVQAATATASNVGTIRGDFYFPQVFSETVFSPDLQRVAFIRATGTTNVQDLYLANADGSGQGVYATGSIQWQGWSPDSSHFVYSLGTPMDLHLGLDGGASTPIGSCDDLRWRNNNAFLCLSGSMGAWTLMRGQISGSLTALVSPVGDFISYDFTP